MSFINSNITSLSINRRKELLEGVYAMGFNKPSRIQEVALPCLITDP